MLLIEHNKYILLELWKKWNLEEKKMAGLSIQKSCFTKWYTLGTFFIQIFINISIEVILDLGIFYVRQIEDVNILAINNKRNIP